MDATDAMFQERREFSAVDPRGELTGVAARLACGHFAGFVHPYSSDWDFPQDEHQCPTCGQLRQFHPAVIAHLERLS